MEQDKVLRGNSVVTRQHTQLHPRAKEHAGNYWERSSPCVQMGGELELVGQEWRWKSLW